MRRSGCARALAAAAVLAVLAAQGATAQDGWKTYVNGRFGTTAAYPADLFTRREPPPANGDGQEFRTADGRARLVIYGTRNAEDDTPGGYLEKYDMAKGASFKRITERFFAISGLRGRDIFYHRCNFPASPGGIIDCFKLVYPAQEKMAWDGIVTRISRSLRAGRGLEPR